MLDGPSSITLPSKSTESAVDMDELETLYKCQQFQDKLCHSYDKLSHNIDQQLEAFVDFIKQTAVSVFGASVKRPRQPWMRQSVFRIVE